MSQEIIKKEETNRIEKFYEPEVDIYETENDVVCVFDIPGVEKDKIKVNFEKSRLTVEAQAVDYINHSWKPLSEEYRIYNYKRALSFADIIDSQKVDAAYDSGILTVKLPKRQEVKPKPIEIKIK